jgi:hypothetical protein
VLWFHILASSRISPSWQIVRDKSKQTETGSQRKPYYLPLSPSWLLFVSIYLCLHLYLSLYLSLSSSSCFPCIQSVSCSPLLPASVSDNLCLTVSDNLSVSVSVLSVSVCLTYSTTCVCVWACVYVCMCVGACVCVREREREEKRERDVFIVSLYISVYLSLACSLWLFCLFLNMYLSHSSRFCFHHCLVHLFNPNCSLLPLTLLLSVPASVAFSAHLLRPSPKWVMLLLVHTLSI